VTTTLSPPVRVFALVGILAVTALGAFFFLVARPSSDEAFSSTPVTKPATKPATTTERPATTRPERRPQTATAQTTSGFPTKVDRALRKRGVAVVVVYMPGSSVDRIVLREARAGAIQARAGYVPINALKERVVRQLVTKTGVIPQPAVLVIKRPGTVKATLGVTDKTTVAQAVALARR
jgi:hypothetical protein